MPGTKLFLNFTIILFPKIEICSFEFYHFKLYFSNQANKVFELKEKNAKGESGSNLCYRTNDKVPNSLLKGNA